MSGRIASSVLVSGLVRMAEAQGGFAAVLAKGDPTAGSVMVVLTERGTCPRILERILQSDGDYHWQGETSQVIDNAVETSDFIARRRRFDPDLWVVELDIPSAERFAAEMNALD